MDHLAERVERRRGRLAVRWEKITRQRRREGLALRVRHRWYILTEWVEPLVEVLLIRWYRFAFRIASHWGRTVAAAGLSFGLAVAVIALLPLGAAAPEQTDTPRADQPSGPVPSIVPSSPPGAPSPVPPSDLSTYTNRLAGYLFSYPGDWDVSLSGTATILLDPEGRIQISFDGAPAGSLQQVSDQVLEQQLTNTYGSPQTIATTVNRTSQGYGSIAVGGIANDATGAQIRFLAITIRGPDENRAILVRFPSDTAPEDLDALIGIVDSFRITRS